MTPGKPSLLKLFAISCGVALSVSSTLAGAQCFLYPLQSEHVREAYFLARSGGSSKLADFLNLYVRTFPPPPTGLYVQSIEFRTPYELVVQRTLERQFNYSSQDAQQDYAKHRGLVVIRVLIFFTGGATQVVSPITGVPIGYPSAAADEPPARQSLDSWHGFHFNITQDAAIKPKKITSLNLTPSASDLNIEQWGVDLAFDAAQFTAGNADIAITSPGGITLRAQFDLAKLK